METKRYIRDFVVEEFDTTEDEFWEALVGSTTIVYKNNMICMMSDTFVYYFGTIKKQRKTKQFYQFYKEFDLKGRRFTTKDLRMYYKRVEKGIII